MRPVECIVECDGKGGLKPMKIRFEDKEGKHVIKIDKIVEHEVKKVFASMNNPAGRAFHYKCESVVDGLRVPFKLMFDNNNCKWYLIT
ncbi:MAG TPA: hypothetical protein VEF53_12260 [Patescibacteria group bacterium]|nr:hypothetical protein [Patescibacteria group bacterium]